VTSPSPDARRTGSPLVLIVDDNEKNLKLARDVLRAAGFRTLERATGTEGIATAREHLPDVILMDLQLPDMDGAAAARQLADGPVTAPIPVVALTSSRIEGVSGWFRAAGFAGYLEKPINVGEFPHQVRRFCRQTAPE
jgi:two-component system cell cycle response regulator DivK